MTWHRVAETEYLLENEEGTVRKDWGGRLPIALVFPNSYYVGMSSLAVHSLYHLWNVRDDTVCERVFSDLLPPLTLESAAPLDYFPIIAFSIAYELDYYNVINILRSAGIPPLAVDRDKTDPLIIAGGPALSANPEPLAPVLDAILIGEVEPVFENLTTALQEIKDSREATLAALASIPGLYLPHLTQDHGNPRVVDRQWLRILDTFETRSVLFSPDTEFANMALVEIARGCGRGCRFCLAGSTYRPPRQRSVDSIVSQARELLNHRDRLGLVSAAVSDHDDIDHLAVELRALGAKLSVSSMRVDPISEPLVQALAESGTRTITIAPEAGSERLRHMIGKSQTEEDVLDAVELAATLDFKQIKLYFMLGLPTESQDDVQALVNLALSCADRFPRQVAVNITPFVPKAHTPYERLPQTPAKTVKRRLSYVERQLRRCGITVKSESPAWAAVQGTLARGDRRVADVLLGAEGFTPAAWRRALGDRGLSMNEFLRQRSASEPLPWSFIRSVI